MLLLRIASEGLPPMLTFATGQKEMTRSPRVDLTVPLVEFSAVGLGHGCDDSADSGRALLGRDVGARAAHVGFYPAGMNHIDDHLVLEIDGKRARHSVHASFRGRIAVEPAC